MTVEVITFGCRLNFAESESIQVHATEAGLGDAVLVNTCAVTAEAVRQARQAIRKVRRQHPKRRIVVTGCAAQIEPETFSAMAEVDAVIGNAEKLSVDSYRRLPDFGVSAEEKVRVSDIFSVRDTASHLVDGFESRARAFVQVQNGCDHRCTFCIIPFGRGSSRSVPMGAVIEDVRRLVAKGYREIVLTGVDLTAWGVDLPGTPRLGGLVRAIMKHVPQLERLRLSSIDCVEADAELMHAIDSEERLMPHLHLSLQAGDDMILKRMKRRHSRADAIRFCEDLRRRRPGILLGADLIAGFPTETDEMFDNTLALIEDCGLSLLHVFPFSARKGTPAARMPQLPRLVVKERAARLRDAASRSQAGRLASEIGARRNVLLEQSGFGRTEHYLPVRVDRGGRGEIHPVAILSVTADELVGSVIQDAA